METKNAITVVEPIVKNDELIERIIDYMNYKGLQYAETTGGLRKDIRNVKSLEFTDQESITQKLLFKHIDREISNHYFNFKAKFKHCDVSKINEMQFLRYDVGGKYTPHTDQHQKYNRAVTVIFNLNEDYEGGEFVFYHPNGKEIIKEVPTKKGQIIYFPSNFMYPHAVKPITKGTRYSIVIWLV